MKVQKWARKKVTREYCRSYCLSKSSQYQTVIDVAPVRVLDEVHAIRRDLTQSMASYGKRQENSDLPGQIFPTQAGKS